MLSDFSYRVRALFRRGAVEQELDQELRFHFERQVDKFMASGLERNEALRRARLTFGGLDQVKEECRQARGVNVLEIILQDVRYASRILLRTPGFTGVAILLLALGIGANAAVFSLIHAVLLRPLPYPEADRVVALTRQMTESNQGAFTVPQFEFWKKHNTVFESIAGHRGGGDSALAIGSNREWIRSTRVATDFFRVLGISPILGREFKEEETRQGGPRAIILTDALWRRSFGADPNVLGRAVRLGEVSYIVVGVLPAAFWFPQRADAYVTLQMGNTLGDSGSNTELIARLKHGVSLRQAQASMAPLFESYRRTDPERVSKNELGLALVGYQEWIADDIHTNLMLLFGAVAVLLLIACSNLAGLLMCRVASRQKEIAVRLAIGSSRGRLLGQFVIENILLTLAGGMAGLVSAIWLIRGLLGFLPFSLPASQPVQLSLPVLLFGFALALLAGLLFSLAPFAMYSRLDLHTALKAAGRAVGAGPGRQRGRALLVIGEVALSATLLVAAGLLLQTLFRLHQERLGFKAEGLYTFETPIAHEQRRSAAQLWEYEANLLDRLRMIPGVRAVAAVNVLPLAGFSNLPTQHEGHLEDSIGGMEYRVVTPSYFETMGIAVLRGRTFSETDSHNSTPVVLVNETVAKAWWPGGNPLGDRIVVGRYRQQEFAGIKEPAREVIGVVADTKTNLKQPARPTIYVSCRQRTENIAQATGEMAWVLRAELTPSLGTEVRHAIGALDPGQRILRLQPMTQIISSNTAESRFSAVLLGIFAGLALTLTAVGVYGLLAYAVSSRRQEIGARIAMGASRFQILQLVLKQGMVLTAIGLVLGLAGAAACARSLRTLLYGVAPNDAMSFVLVSILLLAVGFLASYLPARRATAVDPAVALRYE